MGYTTEFAGSFDLSPPLTDQQVLVLRQLSNRRHEKHEQPPNTSYYCQWVPSEDGTRLEWDGIEKFYGYEGWLRHIVHTFLKPWGVKITGTLTYQGEEVGDAGWLNCSEDWSVRKVPVLLLGDSLSKKHPRQPLALVNGVVRFKENAIVRFLLDYSTARGYGLNEVLMQLNQGQWTKDDYTQLMQLIGYSVSGFGDLNLVDRDVVAWADEEAAKLTKGGAQ